MVIEYLARGVEFAAALIIGIAAVEATIKSLLLFVKRGAPPEQKNEVRLTLGRWLTVALEFELTADILNTAGVNAAQKAAENQYWVAGKRLEW